MPVHLSPPRTYFVNSLDLTAARISSADIDDRSHIPLKIPPTFSYSSSGGPSSTILPASITQLHNKSSQSPSIQNQLSKVHSHPIITQNSPQTMRHTNQRDTPEFPSNRRLDLSIRHKIHTRRSFVQTDDFARFHERACEREERSFTDRKV